MKESDWNEIAKYLSGEMTAGEEKIFEGWLNSEAENIELFNKVKMDWENFEGLAAQVDTQSAWNKLENKLKKDGLLREKKEISLNNLLASYAKVAAMLIVLLVAGYFAYTIFDFEKNIVQTATNESQQIVLPDGSKVTLYQNSKIIYNNDFIAETRLVELEGEAFFEVERNESIPFIVHTETAQVTVLGTSFNVNTKKTENNVEVFVKTGKVELKSDKNKALALYLEPGEIGYCTNGNLEKIKNADDNYIAWKTRNLVFKNTSLIDVIYVVEKVYMIDIQYNEQDVNNLRITTSFNDQKLETVLNVIAKTFDFSYSKNKNQVYLEKMN